MAATSANATITLDLQGTDQSQTHSNAFDNLINALNKLTDKIEKLDKTQSQFRNAPIPESDNISKTSFKYQQPKFVNDFDNAVNEYNMAQIKSANNMRNFGYSMIDISARLMGDGAQYLKASNALIGANLYDRPLKEAEKKIQENTAENKGIADIVGGAIGGTTGALASFGNPIVAAIGAHFGATTANQVADLFSSRYAAYTTRDANIEKQQQVISGFTKQNLIDFTNPETKSKLKVTEDFANLVKTKGMDYALSFQAAQQGILLNTTGTQSITGMGATNLAKEITSRTGEIYNLEQLQQFSSVMSGLFSHSGLSKNSDKQVTILQQILDNASRYGVDPMQYTQQIYQRQQFMGGSTESAMKFVNMGVAQGWNYANTMQQLERAPVSQRLASTFALQMVGFKGSYEDLFKPGGIEQLEQKAGNLRDPLNLKAMVLQGAGIDLWSLKSGSSPVEAQNNNTKAIEKLTNVLLEKVKPMSYKDTMSNFFGNHNKEFQINSVEQMHKMMPNTKSLNFVPEVAIHHVHKVTH